MNDADKKYAKEMIPHHEMAVKMSKMLLDEGQDTKLRDFAQNVIKAQTEEIAWLKDWLASDGKSLSETIEELRRLLAGR